MTLVVFALVLAMRLMANLVLAHTHGRFASPNPEIWFYLGVALDLNPAVYSLSGWDPTVWMLRPLGLLLDGYALYVAILVLGSVSLALASASLAMAARAISGKAACGLAAGLLYAVMPWTYAASLGGLTHDTIGMALAATAIWLLAVATGEGAGTSRRERLMASAALALLVGFGLVIGPTALAVLIVVVLVAIRRGLTVIGSARATQIIGGLSTLVAGYLLLVAATHTGSEGTWVGWVWERLAAAAEGQRGLDIALQSRQGSADLLPGHPRDLLAPYVPALVVPAVAGAVFAWRRRRLAPWLLILVGAVGFCIGHRGIRIVDLAVALGAGLGLADREGHAWLGGLVARGWSPGRRAGLGAVVLAALVAASMLAGPGLPLPPLAAGVAITLAILAAGRESAIARDLLVLASVLLLCVHAHRGSEQVLSVGDTHVELLRSVHEATADQTSARILPASWDLGYMVGAVSGLEPAAHPHLINAATLPEGENDARIFWSPETAAAAEADRRGIRFLYLGERDFSIVEERPVEDRFRMRRRLGFQVPTMSVEGRRGPLPLSIVRHLLIFGLVKKPDRLKHWRLFEEARDPRTGELIRVFELVEPPDPERTFVFAIFDNPTADLEETQVQLFLDAKDGSGTRQGARLTSRLRPLTSSLSIFSFIGVEEGRGRAELSNPRMELRMVSHLTGGRYAVDFARPRSGWRPLELR